MDTAVRERIRDCLTTALDADDSVEREYHIRQALQLLDTTDGAADDDDSV